VSEEKEKTEWEEKESAGVGWKVCSGLVTRSKCGSDVVDIQAQTSPGCNETVLLVSVSWACRSVAERRAIAR
jgi:hypothetical protein